MKRSAEGEEQQQQLNQQQPGQREKKLKTGEDGQAAVMVELDENLHSRQLAVYGREVMKRITTASVLVCGANGLGLEVGGLGCVCVC